MNNEDDLQQHGEQAYDRAELSELKLFVADDLYRAWQRCSWVISRETGRSRIDVMGEMVRDFLVKHGC